MVSAVFHSPSEVDDAVPATAASPAQIAPAPVQKAAPAPGSSPAKPPVDWVGWALRTVSPLAGIALLIGVWALLTQNSGTFPTPLATWPRAAIPRGLLFRPR